MNESKAHLLKSLNENLRYDGRGLLDFRKIEIETGVSKSAEGSARVKLGETEVIAGVKMELGKPYPDTPDEGTIMVGAELIPLSSPDFESGPPDIKSIEIARVVDRGIRESKAIDFKKLCIKEGEKSWIVTIDIVTINDAGNLQDASYLAAMAAVKDARFPKLEGEKVNYKELTETKLPLTKEPVEVTVLKIGDKLIVDPSTEEEKLIDARLTIAITEDGRLCALQKGGDYPLSLDEIDAMIGIAAEKTKELRSALKAVKPTKR